MNFILTKAGSKLIQEVIYGAKIIYTKAEAGGEVSSNPISLMSVQNKKQDIIINDIIQNENEKGIGLTLTNLEVREEYILKQIGVYAKTESTEEVLFLIGQDDIGERVPAITDREVVYDYEIFIKNSNSYQMELNISVNGFIKKDIFDREIGKIKFPEFEDDGNASSITKFDKFIESIASGMNLFDFFKNFKSSLKYILHSGMLVDNCISDATDKVLSANQGRILNDKVTGATRLIIKTLPSSLWREFGGLYIQELIIPEIKNTDNPSLVMQFETTANNIDDIKREFKAYTKNFSYIIKGTTETGKVSFMALKQPVIDLKIGLKGV